MTGIRCYGPQAPCKDCEDRCMGCHSKCEKYIAYHESREKYLKENFDRKGIENGLYNLREGRKDSLKRRDPKYSYLSSLNRRKRGLE